jgi:hypothetical protein
MRLFALAAAISLAAAAAWADGPEATASSADPSPPQPQAAAPPLPADQGGAKPAEPVALGPCGSERVKSDGTLDTAPHGAIEAGIGTHGYRRLAGAVCQPIGQNASVAVSAGVSQAQWGRR